MMAPKENGAPRSWRRKVLQIDGFQGRRVSRRIARRGPYSLRHTLATEALAAGISIFELARLMGTSVSMIDRTYGHLARDSEEAIRGRLEARSARSGDEMASDAEGE